MCVHRHRGALSKSLSALLNYPAHSSYKIRGYSFAVILMKPRTVPQSIKPFTQVLSALQFKKRSTVKDLSAKKEMQFIFATFITGFYL